MSPQLPVVSGPDVIRALGAVGFLQVSPGLPYTPTMARSSEIEFVFEPQDEGGYHAYAPDLPDPHTQGDTLEEAIANAEEALQLYVEGLREEGRPLGAGVVRRTLPVPS